MASLFISYAREDASVAARIAAALEAAGHQVWWDLRLAPGAEYSPAIERALEESDRVLVLWSAHAAGSAWVRDEAAAGRDAGKLVPLTIDGGTPPLGFRQYQLINLRPWLASGADQLPAALGAALGDDAGDQREILPEQHIAFCRTSDGVSLAYSLTGEGPPLVKTANWLNHLEYEWGNPLWQHWIAELSRSHRLLRYDERGNGMSDWKVPELSFDLFVDDLKTVVDSAGLERFDVVAISQGSPVAVAFAARFPERVRRLVLINGFAAGWRHTHDAEVIERWEAMITLAKTGWGRDNPAFRQMFTSLFFPDANAEQMRWWNDLQKMSASPANAQRLMQVFGEIDVRGELGLVKAPTLVIHCRDDQLVPFEAGRRMASGIPDARFLAIDSSDHLVTREDPGWPRLRDEVRAFLAPD